LEREQQNPFIHRSGGEVTSTNSVGTKENIPNQQSVFNHCTKQSIRSHGKWIVMWEILHV